ncbi:MAG: PucR family transcriptional regulator ligand-binding domain-containing protein, partial [Synergistaceae bacterium]|nr:PucR family transcriptional regulator ligand-binding domain-containing protein [Synergistaceae bacterium]
MSVQKMIERGGFSDFVVYAGERGLDEREVRTVCVIDAVDIENWLFGGEFLLTSGYIFRERPEHLAALIEAADRKGAAGLGVKIGRYIDRMPREVLKMADKLSFPLIGVPFHYAHTDIINPAFFAIADSRVESIKKTEDLRRQFFDDIFDMDAPRRILSLLSDSMDRSFMFLDVSTGKREISGSSELGQVASDLPLAFLADHFRHEEIFVSGRKCARTDKPDGYLFYDGRTPDESSSMLVRGAKDALELHLRWARELWKIESGRGPELVQDILYKRFKRSEEIKNKGVFLGWDFDGRHAVALLTIDRSKSVVQATDEPDSSAYDIFRESMRKVFGKLLYADLKDGAAFILKVPENGWNDLKKTLTDVFKTAQTIARNKTGLQITLGAGAPVDDVIDCDRSFREARRAAYMSLWGENPTLPRYWDEMGVYRILASVYENREATDFLNENLGPVIKQSARARAQDSLLETLFCLIRNNWQMKPVAAEMNLHYNTVKYRYRKIAEASGMDLESRGVRLSMALAMELYMLQ